MFSSVICFIIQLTPIIICCPHSINKQTAPTMTLFRWGGRMAAQTTMVGSSLNRTMHVVTPISILSQRKTVKRWMSTSLIRTLLKRLQRKRLLLPTIRAMSGILSLTGLGKLQICGEDVSIRHLPFVIQLTPITCCSCSIEQTAPTMSPIPRGLRVAVHTPSMMSSSLNLMMHVVIGGTQRKTVKRLMSTSLT